MAYTTRSPKPGYKALPFSMRHLKELEIGATEDKLAGIVPLMPKDYFYKVYDFENPTMTADWVAANTGTAPTDFAFNKQRGGAIRGATGTTANNVVAVYYANEIFDAADNPGMLLRFKAPAAVTSMVLEIGFSDPKTSESAVSVSDVDTPAVANGITDAGILVIDTAQTLTTMALVGVGTSTAVAKTNVGTFTPTVSKFVDVVMQIEAGRVTATVWCDGVAQKQYTVASGPDAGVLIRPWFLIKTLNTTTKAVDITKIVLWAEDNQS